MTSSSADTTAADTSRTGPVLCCRKPLSTIAVTTRGATLTLLSCTACGHHIWQKDGVTADRADLLDGVATFLEQPREIVRRRSPRRRDAQTPQR